MMRHPVLQNSCQLLYFQSFLHSPASDSYQIFIKQVHLSLVISADFKAWRIGNIQEVLVFSDHLVTPLSIFQYSVQISSSESSLISPGRVKYYFCLIVACLYQLYPWLQCYNFYLLVQILNSLILMFSAFAYVSRV